MYLLPPAPRDPQPRPIIRHFPPPKRGGSDIGEGLLCAALIAIAITSFALFWRPFRADAMMVAADSEARTPLLIDASGKDDALQALYEVRLCASAWRIELGSRAEFYCVTRVSQKYRELKRSAQ
jgi:hypothetical protein